MKVELKKRKLNVYFVAAISAVDRFQSEYQSIINSLQEMGCNVWGSDIFEKDIQKIERQTQEQRKIYYQQMINRIKNCDVMVAEVSFPSTIHVGQESTWSKKNHETLGIFDVADSRSWLLARSRMTVTLVKYVSLSSLHKTFDYVGIFWIFEYNRRHGLLTTSQNHKLLGNCKEKRGETQKRVPRLAIGAERQ